MGGQQSTKTKERYFKIVTPQNCRNWTIFSVDVQPYDAETKSHSAHVKIKATKSSHVSFYIAEPDIEVPNPTFHIAVLAENIWICEGKQYKYLMAHELGEKGKNSLASIRLHLSNDM